MNTTNHINNKPSAPVFNNNHKSWSRLKIEKKQGIETGFYTISYKSLYHIQFRLPVEKTKFCNVSPDHRKIILVKDVDFDKDATIIHMNDGDFPYYNFHMISGIRNYIISDRPFDLKGKKFPVNLNRDDIYYAFIYEVSEYDIQNLWQKML